MSRIIVKLNGEEYYGEKTNTTAKQDAQMLYSVLSERESTFELKQGNGNYLVLSRRMMKRAVFIILE